MNDEEYIYRDTNDIIREEAENDEPKKETPPRG